LYALQAGLVPVRSARTRVSLLNTRTGLLLDAEVDTPDGVPPTIGREVIPGTVYPGVRVTLTWRPLTWSTYGPTVSTGAPVDVLTVAGMPLRATLIDAGAPAVFVRAEDFGLDGLTDSVAEINSRLAALFELRRAAAPLMAIPDVPGGFQSVPKVGIVGRPRSGETDLEARMVSMTAAHPSVGITSAIALAAATAVRGSTVDGVLSRRLRESGAGWHELSIGTLAGPVRIEVERSADGDVTAVRCTRSARRLADARTHVPADWSPTILATT
jgi:2-methylaconitate cis-trans-isomerase PrpF